MARRLQPCAPAQLLDYRTPEAFGALARAHANGALSRTRSTLLGVVSNSVAALVDDNGIEMR